MRPSSLPPILFEFHPVYKDYLWGGRRIPLRFHRPDCPAGRCAESWEVADRPDGMSHVKRGPFDGMTLQQLVRDYANELIGAPAAVFPLLVKILDAAETLSVQVHPDEETARRLGGDPKTECWFVLDTEPDAICRLGLKPGTTPQQLRNALATDTIADYLQCFHPIPGQLLYVPAGRVHAIGPGCLFLEVQQNSNTVYRLYDWNRRDPTTGKPRTLHVEEAITAIRWNDPDVSIIPPEPWITQNSLRKRTRLSTPFFQIEELEIWAPTLIEKSSRRFDILFALENSARIETDADSRLFRYGSTLLIPAVAERYQLHPQTVPLRLLRIGPPLS